MAASRRDHVLSDRRSPVSCGTIAVPSCWRLLLVTHDTMPQEGTFMERMFAPSATGSASRCLPHALPYEKSKSPHHTVEPVLLRAMCRL